MISDISYFILDWNPLNHEESNQILYKTLLQFYKLKSKNLSSELLLIDQGGSFERQSFIDSLHKEFGFNLLTLQENVGISRGINYAVRLAKAPVIGFISSDVLFTKGLDEDLYTKIQIPEVYQTTPLTNRSEISLQQFATTESFGSELVNLTALLPGYIRTIGVEFNIMFWRQEIFEKIGYYDERFKAGFENNDFGLRCYLDGGVTAISRDSFIWHYHNQTIKSGAMNQINYSYNGCEVWNEKWSAIGDFSNFLYREIPENENRRALQVHFANQIYLPYRQKVNY